MLQLLLLLAVTIPWPAPVRLQLLQVLFKTLNMLGLRPL